MPPDWSFFSHISPVVLSVTVPSPLSVNDWLAPFWRSPSLPVPYAVVWPVLSGGGWHTGSGAPPRAAATSSVHCVIKVWICACVALDGHCPMPCVLAFPNLPENVASHAVKSGDPPAFTALDTVFNRQ